MKKERSQPEPKKTKNFILNASAGDGFVPRSFHLLLNDSAADGFVPRSFHLLLNDSAADGTPLYSSNSS